jgi:hypothetical protein
MAAGRRPVDLAVIKHGAATGLPDHDALDVLVASFTAWIACGARKGLSGAAGKPTA